MEEIVERNVYLVTSRGGDLPGWIEQCRASLATVIRYHAVQQFAFCGLVRGRYRRGEREVEDVFKRVLVAKSWWGLRTHGEDGVFVWMGPRHGK